MTAAKLCALRALTAPLAAAHFGPTGGINLENTHVRPAIPHVAYVGGSWMVQHDLADKATVEEAGETRLGS